MKPQDVVECSIVTDLAPFEAELCEISLSRIYVGRRAMYRIAKSLVGTLVRLDVSPPNWPGLVARFRSPSE